MKITILCVGKIKEKYFTDAVSEYKKRMGRYCTFEIKEVADEKTIENPSPAQLNQIIDREADRMLKYWDDSAYHIALCIDGKQLDSVELSEKIQSIMLTNSHIVLVIGGSLGLSQSIVNRCQFKLSFSKMTFPHQLMRVILCEQIYRAFRIANNEPYHK